MRRFVATVVIIALSIFGLLVCPQFETGQVQAVSMDPAGTALPQLDIPRAKELFSAALKKDSSRLYQAARRAHTGRLGI